MTIQLSHGTRIPVPSFDERLAMARRDAGLTQERMAELIGCSKRTIVRYESGKATVPPIVAVAYSVATDVNLGWIQTGSAVHDDQDWRPDVVRPKGFEPPTFWSVVNSLQRSGRTQACDLSDDLAFWAIVEDVERTTRVSGPLDHKAGAERIRVALRPGRPSSDFPGDELQALTAAEGIG